MNINKKITLPIRIFIIITVVLTGIFVYAANTCDSEQTKNNRSLLHTVQTDDEDREDSDFDIDFSAESTSDECPSTEEASKSESHNNILFFAQDVKTSPALSLAYAFISSFVPTLSACSYKYEKDIYRKPIPFLCRMYSLIPLFVCLSALCYAPKL